MGCKILLADDSITIQKVVNLTFDDEGIDVVSVSNGDQAERKLNEVNPDLVLADIFMPGKNGYELCEIIKKNPQFSDVPVVLLVGAFEPFDQNEARRVGADDHLTKPFESRKLVETVRRLIGMRQQSRPQQPAVAPPQQAAQTQTQDRGERTTDPLEDKSERTTDPLDAKPFMQTLELGMSGPPDQARATGANDASPLNESAPIEIDYSPAQPQTEPVAESEFHFAPPERTGDLSTDSLQDEIAFETTPLEGIEFPGEHRSAEVMLEAGGQPAQEDEPAQPRAWEESDSPHSFSFGEDTPDFEKLDSVEPPLSDTVFAVDIDADSSSSRETREWASDSSAWQPSLPESSRLDVTGGAPYAAGQASEAGETASATLLAVEDPLGDVLMDEATPEQPVFESQWQPADGAELNLDFSSPEAAPLPPISEVAPEYAETHKEESEPLAQEPVAALEQPRQESAAEPEIVFNPEADLQTQPSSDFASVETEEARQEEAPETDRDEPRYDFSQASEQGFEAVSNEAAGFETADTESEHAPVEGFTSSVMWTEEEARFAPIDIEAVPVDEASSQAAGRTQAAEQETGFEFSQIVTDDAGASPDYPPATEPESEPAAAGQPESQVVDLSQSAIDEIVRRVVAELSDRVVREIAWEVVPDMVERVVEKLARESLSKRT
jgi:CheY-like chemotaxis protein